MATDQLQFQSVDGLKDRNENPVRLTKISWAYGPPALLYQCPLNVDWDGSAKAYGVNRPGKEFPLQKDLDPHETGLGNARGGDGTWAGVYSANEAEARWILRTDTNFGRTEKERLALLPQFIDNRFHDINGRFPVVQIQADAPAQGYYVSQCPATKDASKYLWDQNRYWDAAKVAYQALSDLLLSLGRVGLNDYGLVIRNSTTHTMAFFFGDRGGKGSYKVGECSGVIKQELAAEKNGEDDVFSFLVFPGSGSGVPSWQARQFSHMVVRSRIANLSMASNARDLAVRLAMGRNFNQRTADARDTQTPGYQQIKRAFMRWGWDPDGPGVSFPDVDADQE
jgi:hypothetical protein